jgi:hypothetical protein
MLAVRGGERLRREPVALLAHRAHRGAAVAMVDDRRERPAGEHCRAARQQHQRVPARIPLSRVDQTNRLDPDPAGASTERLDPSLHLLKCLGRNAKHPSPALIGARRQAVPGGCCRRLARA